MLGGISLFLTVLSTGYSLTKEILEDLDKSSHVDEDIRKKFRKMPKSQRQKLMKDYMRDYMGDEFKK